MRSKNFATAILLISLIALTILITSQRTRGQGYVYPLVGSAVKIENGAWDATWDADRDGTTKNTLDDVFVQWDTDRDGDIDTIDSDITYWLEDDPNDIIYLADANNTVKIDPVNADGLIIIGGDSGKKSLTIKDNTTNFLTIDPDLSITLGSHFSIKSTPETSSQAVIAEIEADGNNWATGSGCLKLISDHDNCYLIKGFEGTTQNLYIDRSGNIVTKGDIYGWNALDLKTQSNANITLLPNGSGITIIGDASIAERGLAANDDLQVRGKIQVGGNTYIESYVYLYDATNLRDDVELQVGDAADARLLWETADADAHKVILALPSGTSERVPVFVIGDANIRNSDLGWFDGVTGPRIAIVDADEDSYITVGASNTDDVFEITLGGNAVSLDINTGNGAAKKRYWQATLADDANIALPSITYHAFGSITISDPNHAMEYADFVIDADGDVTLKTNSSNVVNNADTDDKFCIGTAATQEPLDIKNRLGGTANYMIELTYN